MPANTTRGYTYPLYADTQNFPAQIQDLAQDIDLDVDQLADRVAAANAAASVLLRTTTTPLIAPNVTTTIQFGSEDFDNAGLADLAVNNTRISIQNTAAHRGVYIISGYVKLLNNSAPAAMDVNIISDGTLIPNPVAAGIPTDDNHRGALGLSTLYLRGVVGPTENITMTIRHNMAASAQLVMATLSATRIVNF